jgi:hypothetical protein
MIKLFHGASGAATVANGYFYGMGDYLFHTGEAIFFKYNYFLYRVVSPETFPSWVFNIGRSFLPYTLCNKLEIRKSYDLKMDENGFFPLIAGSAGGLSIFVTPSGFFLYSDPSSVDNTLVRMKLAPVSRNVVKLHAQLAMVIE